MIRTMEQDVNVLPALTEAQILELLSKVTSTPYAKEPYDEEKTKAVIGSCVKRGHLSILEHASISLNCLTNIETYKDFTRHRHCAFTIESTSFVRYDELPVITVKPLTQRVVALLHALHDEYNATNNPKVGRDILPQCTAARMIMTTNIREWRYIIGLRGDPNDNPLTNDLRTKIWTVLAWQYPFFFPMVDSHVSSAAVLAASTNPMTIYNQWGKHEVAVI